jgi:general secretion pathway protein I
VNHAAAYPTRIGGFTLIEVLVALVIVAIGMAALLGALTSSANTTVYLRDKTFAEWVGLNRIAEARLKLQRPAKGNTTGDVDFAGRKWHWRQEVVETQVPGILRIDVKVRPGDIKAGEDDSWYTTISGLSGDAVAPSRGDMPLWSTAGGQGQNGTGGVLTPGTVNTPGSPGPVNPPGPVKK